MPSKLETKSGLSNQGNSQDTFPMRQCDATPQKPFYSVCYQYASNPWTLWGHHHYGGPLNGTQRGTSSFDVAKAQADKLVKMPGIAYAQVSKTEDCYNHQTVYTVNS